MGTKLFKNGGANYSQITGKYHFLKINDIVQVASIVVDEEGVRVKQKSSGNDVMWRELTLIQYDSFRIALRIQKYLQENI